MTYLELVNEVLVRLRERSVSTVGQTTYSAMVGKFINDAKRQLETAWNWNANREIITLNTIADISTYGLTDFGQQGTILSAWNDTDNRSMYERSQGWADRQNYVNAPISGSPYQYCIRGEDASDDTQVELFPTPDAVYSLKFSSYIPQAELSDDTDSLNIPWRPVVLQAVAMLAEEKGETGGSASARYFEMADKAISDAISIDANRFPTELNWFMD